MVEGKEDLETQGHQLLYISNHPCLLAYMRIKVEISVPNFDKNSNSTYGYIQHGVIDKDKSAWFNNYLLFLQ